MRRVTRITGLRAAGKSTLGPLPAAIVEREIGRKNNSYRDRQEPGMSLRDAVESLRRGLLDTPERGLRPDTGAMTVRASVEAILPDDMAGSRY